MRASSASPLVIFLAAAFVVCCLVAEPKRADRISIGANEPERRVDIAIDGKPFTSYIWPTTLKKPVLYPLRTANGTVVTLGYPLEQRPGERIDHPHHAGLWLNYENVNGIDFWNNSDAIKIENAPKMGNIVPRSFLSTKSGSQGELDIEADWVTYEKKVLLKEHTHFVIRGGPGVRSVDRI